MPKKIIFFDRIKLWLWKKMETWYISRAEYDYFTRNRVFINWIRVVIESDFGQKCRDFNISCAVCQAYLCLSILENLYWEERNTPEIFNKCIDNTFDEKIEKYINNPPGGCNDCE